MVEYGGTRWVSLAAACRDLRLDYETVAASGETLEQYLEHCYLVNGVLYTSLEAVALNNGISLARLKSYLEGGLGLELAIAAAQRGISKEALGCKR